MRMSKMKLLAVGLVLALAFLVSLGAADLTAPVVMADGEGARVVVEETTQESKFEVKIWTDKPSYQVGETVTAFVQSEEAGYLTIYDFPPGDQRPHLIYPNRVTGYDPAVQWIEANRTYQIPAPGAGFVYRVAPPPGTEMFVAVVTKKPGIAPLPEVEARAEEVFPEFPAPPEEFASEMKVVVEETEEDWGMGYTTFTVGPGQPPQPELSEQGWVYQQYREEVTGRITTAWPIGFNPDGASQIGNWYWLSDQAFRHWSAWKFNATNTLAAAREAWLDFRLLVTNALQGGQGYETTVKVTVKVLSVNGTVVHEQRNQVKLNNPVRPKDPTYSYGVGWQTYGLLQIPSNVIQTLPIGGKIIVKVERDPAVWDAGYQPVVGTNMNALVLRYR